MSTLVDAMARAMFGCMNWPAYDYDRANPAMQEYTRKAALAALKAMKEHGPTEAMLEAVGGVFVDYGDMLQAAIEEAQP